VLLNGLRRQVLSVASGRVAKQVFVFSRQRRRFGAFEPTNARPRFRGREGKHYPLTFNQTNITSTWTLLRLLDGELDALSFPEQFENGPPHRTAVEEMLEAGFVPNEPEPLID
jgi:hypothetical protein